MSTIGILGSIGIGAVFGWLIGILEPRRQLFRQVLSIGLVGALALLEIVWQVGWQAALAAMASGILTLLIHKLWRIQLRQR